MHHFPAFIKLDQQPCLVVGGGDVAFRKINLLLDSGANVVVLAPGISKSIARLLLSGQLSHLRKIFEASDIQGFRLIIAATSDAAVNQHIFTSAEAAGVLVNVVDNPGSSRFIFPAIVDRSPITIAISSGGHAPVLARLLRQKIEALIPAAYGTLAAFAGSLRNSVKTAIAPGARRVFWEEVLDGPIAERVLSGRPHQARVLFDEKISRNESSSPIGEVYLVGAGPGDPELVTLKALHLMQQADVVFYDNLVSEDVLNLVRRDSIKIPVFKIKGRHAVSQAEINDQLIRYAREGKRVCRLKGGDPFVFGRGGEELESLVAADIPFQIVPGISAANGCASYAGIPLTHRDYADTVTFLTGHKQGIGELGSAIKLPWPGLSNPRQTLVFYMALSGLNRVCGSLISAGLPADTPAAAIERGTTAEQRTIVSTLDRLGAEVAASNFVSPTLIIVGQVVRLAPELHWFGGEPLMTDTTRARFSEVQTTQTVESLPLRQASL